MVRSKGSVLHRCTFQTPPPNIQHLDVVSTCLTKQQIASVVNFVANSFARDHRGTVMQISQGLYGNSQFYAGRETIPC